MTSRELKGQFIEGVLRDLNRRYFNNDWNGHAPANARLLARKLGLLWINRLIQRVHTTHSINQLIYYTVARSTGSPKRSLISSGSMSSRSPSAG